MLILLMTPSLAALRSGAEAEAPVAIDPMLAAVLARWIQNGGVDLDAVPTRADAAFEFWTRLAAGPDLADVAEPWLAYRRAFGLDLDPSEARALAAFEKEHPNVAREVGRLAASVAVAETLRASVFDVLDPAERARLPGLAAALAREDALAPSDMALIAKLDLELLGRAGALLARAAQDAPARLAEAARLDAARALELAARRDGLAAVQRETGWPDVTAREPSVAELVAPFAAEPRRPGGDLVSTLVRAGASDREAFAAAAATPASLRGPIAELLSAALVDDPEEARGALGAFVRLEQRLAAEAYRASTETPGRARESLGLPRAIGTVSVASPASVVGPALADALAAPVPGPVRVASFGDGLAALHANRGTAPGEVPELDLTMDAALGTLLLAIATYERDFGAESAEIRALESARATARELLEDGVRSGADFARLRDAVRTELRHRESLAGAVMTIVDAVEHVRAATPTGGMRTSASTTAGGDDVIYRDSFVVITGAGSSEHTLQDFHKAPVLLVDLGGNDRYAAPIGGVDAGDPDLDSGHPSRLARVSIALDLGGDDRYETDQPWVLGAARGAGGAPAFALFLDASGDDVYALAGPALGVGWDGFGFAFDLSGNDRFQVASRGLGSASTTKPGDVGIGIFADRLGNDNYTSGSGFASLAATATARSTTALFVDGGGMNNYTGVCSNNPAISCFASPRPREGGSLTGTVVFADLGVNHPTKYPRPGDPNNGPLGGNAGSSAAEVVAGFNRATTEGGPPPPPTGYMYPDPDRSYAVITNGVGVNLADGDGDGLYDQYDPSPERRSNPDDTDGDGVPDEIESLLGTSPDDASSRPIDATSPEGSSSGLLVDLPGILAIGAAGVPSRFESTYRISIDLGLDDADDYRGDVASAASNVPASVTNVAGGENAFRNLRRTFPVSIGLDFGGDDAYTPSNRNGSLASATGPSVALLVDYGGDDRYRAHGFGLAAAAGVGSLAIMVDVAGDDRYEYPYGGALGFAIAGGQAAFVDLAGADRYVAPTQGHVFHFGGGGSQAIFLDREGDDVYDVGTIRDFQVAPHLARGHASGTAPAPAAPVVPTFLDLGGRDTYTEWDAVRGQRDAARFAKDDAIRFRSIESSNNGILGTFIDTEAGSNKDGTSPTDADLVEALADTDPGAGSDGPVQSPGFLLRLPRFGVAVGDDTASVWNHGQDYALSIDLGGNDRYTGRIGATSPAWSTSLHVDVGGSDEYLYEGGTELSRWRPLSGAPAGAVNPAPPSAPLCGNSYCESFVGSAHGAGVLGIGVLRDGGGRDVFHARVTSSACNGCNLLPPIYGVFQGAGLLGVGILSTTGRANFTARAGPLEPVDPATTIVPSAWTHAQGAGVLGYGLLASDGIGADEYLLETKNVDANARASGQGFGLGGVGILVDAGGDNVLRANRSAQGAGFAVNGITGSGILVFAGPGNDDLGAESDAQGHGAAGSTGILIDMEGDDRRVLAGTNRPGQGQGFGVANGVGLLVDNRGDDFYGSYYNGVADLTQGAMNVGSGILLDFGGDDRYDAAGSAQGWAPAASGIALLYDRNGNDTYRLRSTALGHGRGPAGPALSLIHI